MWDGRARRRGAATGVLAGEGHVSYRSDEGAPVTLAELRERGLDVTGLADVLALDALAGEAFNKVELSDEHDSVVADAAVGLQRIGNRWTGAHLRVLAEAERRRVFAADGAVTLASWLRARTGLEDAHAGALVRAALRIEGLPHLQAAIDRGQTGLAQVLAVTTKCIPRRASAFAEADQTLADLASRTDASAVRIAVKRVVDAVDPDGSGEPELPEGPRDHRRELHLSPTLDGLWALRGVLDTLTGEKLAAFLDAFLTFDDPDVPEELRRTPAQQRHDAFDALLERVQGIPNLPQVHGRPPHILGMFDLEALTRAAGRSGDGPLADDPAGTPAARLRYSGPISTSMLLHLLERAAFTAVTVEDGRPVNVGRRMRTLPAYLRDVLQLLHRRCRGPDCTRWVTWSQAHHTHPWEAGGDTDLNASIPVCTAHHQLCANGWTATLDPHTRIVTWTTPTGRTITVHP
jgi:hypothetical protein